MLITSVTSEVWKGREGLIVFFLYLIMFKAPSSYVSIFNFIKEPFKTTNLVTMWRRTGNWASQVGSCGSNIGQRGQRAQWGKDRREGSQGMFRRWCQEPGLGRVIICWGYSVQPSTETETSWRRRVSKFDVK